MKFTALCATFLAGSLSWQTSTAQLGSELGLQLPGYPSSAVQLKYDELVRLVDWKQVETDIQAVLTDSKDWWPADYGNYGGLFVRLAWHAAGTYRKSDGRGGGEGGAQRYVDVQVCCPVIVLC
jgi:catalase (peroxidase I)